MDEIKWRKDGDGCYVAELQEPVADRAAVAAVLAAAPEGAAAVEFPVALNGHAAALRLPVAPEALALLRAALDEEELRPVAIARWEARLGALDRRREAEAGR